MPKITETPMRDLVQDPLWREEDLGKPIADSLHGVSVCLPQWKHIVGYEEGDQSIIGKMQCGYPRFFTPLPVQNAQREVAYRVGRADEICLLFQFEESARQCLNFIGDRGRVLVQDDVYAVLCPKSLEKEANLFRQHSGEMISSRQAEDFLGGTLRSRDLEQEARLKSHITKLCGREYVACFLYANGMSAFYHLHRAIQSLGQGQRMVQFGFPYVDALKVQQKFPPGTEFISDMSEEGYRSLAQTLEEGDFAAVYVEFPTNPLLVSPDLERLGALCQKKGVLLVVDDTIGGFANVDVLQYADVSWSSLTKLFSGSCNVMGGTTLINTDVPRAEQLVASLETEGGDSIYYRDLEVLECQSKDYLDRAQQINQKTKVLVDMLVDHPSIDAVYYPDHDATHNYQKAMKVNGGFGGLFSFVLKNPESTSESFYDQLELSKGPSLGTNFSLVCPYTLLAHYHELDWAESCGVSRWLIRVSIGLEESNVLTERFKAALSKI
ncbi:MAG: PLP-dependent transferase [Verrucomicrobiota bacterium]